MNPHARRRLIFWASALLIIGSVVLTSLLFYWKDVETEFFGQQITLSPGLLTCIALFLYFIASYRIVGESEVGLLSILGIPLRHIKSGPVWVPLLLCRLEIFPGTIQQDELPADPEDIVRNEDVQEVPEGKFPPNRFTFKKVENSDDPLDQRVTAEVPVVIAWRVEDTVVFANAIGSRPLSALKEAKRQMNDTAVTALGDYFGKKTSVKKALENKAVASKVVKKAIDKVTEAWGIQVVRAEVKAILLNHALNGAMAEVPKAAYRAAAKAKEGEGVKAFADKSGVTPEMTITLEAVKALAEKGNTYVAGGQGIADILGIVKAARKTT